MADTQLYKIKHVSCSSGSYDVMIGATPLNVSPQYLKDRRFAVLIDHKVSALYSRQLSWLEHSVSIIKIEATELSKDLVQIPTFISKLTEAGIRRGDLLLCIGGGVLQDIACFISTILFRGTDWVFMPTTLLAQADSCIGSKSSINVSGIKNLVGTFTPPRCVDIRPQFLSSLQKEEIASGLGEVAKIGLIASSELAQRLDLVLDKLLPKWQESNQNLFLELVDASLTLKMSFVEIDEFDKGPRLVLNYGHSFGHAIESATNYRIPHGIAVAMGCDMANFVAAHLDLANVSFYKKWHRLLFKLYEDFATLEVPIDDFLSAIGKDKKNTATNLTLILPDLSDTIARTQVPRSERFAHICQKYFEQYRAKAL
jgi:3-dehydroquinate synthase